MQTLLTCFVTRLQTKFLLLIIRASKHIYILVIGQISSFANILPANWFTLAYSPIFYPSSIFPRTVYAQVWRDFSVFNPFSDEFECFDPMFNKRYYWILMTCPTSLYILNYCCSSIYVANTMAMCTTF